MNKKKSSILIYILLFIFFLLSAFKIYFCPLKYIFGLSCPTCGLTRAIISAFQFDFSKAFFYHMFWPVVIVGFIIYVLYDFKILNISKKNILLTLYTITFFNIIYYFYRLFNNSSVVNFDFHKSLLYKIISIFR